MDNELIKRIDVLLPCLRAQLAHMQVEVPGFGNETLLEEIKVLQDCKAALSQQEAEPVGYLYRFMPEPHMQPQKPEISIERKSVTNPRWVEHKLYLRPPKPAAHPIEPSPQSFCKTCGGTKVDPGGLKAGCRDCSVSQKSVTQDSEDSFERWVNTHPGYTYRDVWQAGREYQSRQPVASVPQDVKNKIAELRNTRGYENLHVIIGKRGAEIAYKLIDILDGRK